MHWQNSAFQVTYFLAGKCHTPDGAYRMLKELREERALALDVAVAANLRGAAKIAKAKHTLCNVASEWERLEAKADLAEIEAFRDQGQACVDEAEREVEFIDALIDYIQPFRKYAHLPDHEAFQACQREEWALELVRRAENYLITGQGIPADHFETMRLHPDFKSFIAPRIEGLYQKLQAGELNLGKIESVLLPCIEQAQTRFLADKHQLQITGGDASTNPSVTS